MRTQIRSQPILAMVLRNTHLFPTFISALERLCVRQDVPVPGSMPDSGLRGSPAARWYDAWRAAATGPDGFWRTERPATHFRTAAGGTTILAELVLALLSEHPGISTVVDIGAGDGELLADLGVAAPRLRLLGLELRPLPAHRPAIEWRQGYWDVHSAAWCPPVGDPVALRSVLPAGEPMAIVCSEWLDDLPAVVAERDATGWKELLVGPDGQELAGPPVPAADRDWLERWWPARPGTRAESGRTRDTAWSAVIGCLRPAGGLAVMIDYGHHRALRPAAGTLTGYQGGRQVPPRPSPAINLTAHVAVDSVQQAGADQGARTEFLITQREAVERLLPGSRRTAESGTLARLQAVGERRLLTDALGDHWWLVQSVAPGGPATTGSPAAG